jgi:hypothetical protein
MKTKELIRLLQEADPIGNEDVVVDNCDIWQVYPEEAHYDGCKQLLVRDKRIKNRYDIKGMKISDKGKKISIFTYDWKEAILNNPEVKIELDLTHKEEYEKEIKDYRNYIRKLKSDIENEKNNE